MFNYGDRARDKITGFEGIVTGRISHYGMRPDQYILESLMSEGYTYTQTVDVNRLIPANENKVALVPNGCLDGCKVNKVHLCED